MLIKVVPFAFVLVTKMVTPMEEDTPESFENYLIKCAKKSLESDISEAKAWLLTAKVLFPNAFGVQVRKSILT